VTVLEGELCEKTLSGWFGSFILRDSELIYQVFFAKWCHTLLICAIMMLIAGHGDP
jgi:hypothetical protein